MRRTMNPTVKTFNKIADQIAQVSGYKDHKDALAHKDPITGKVPIKNPDIKPKVEIKKRDNAHITYGDHACQIKVAATYDVFADGKKVGFIYANDIMYLDVSRHWDVCTEQGHNLQRFYRPNAFKKAKEFALNHDWTKEIQ